jgi:hypothetical protein
MPFSILILVCSLAVSHADCQPDTAISTTAGPPVQNEMMCGLRGQTTIATTQVAPRPGEYLKLVCSRSGPQREHAAADGE